MCKYMYYVLKKKKTLHCVFKPGKCVIWSPDIFNRILSRVPTVDFRWGSGLLGSGTRIGGCSRYFSRLFFEFYFLDFNKNKKTVEFIIRINLYNIIHGLLRLYCSIINAVLKIRTEKRITKRQEKPELDGSEATTSSTRP